MSIRSTVLVAALLAANVARADSSLVVSADVKSVWHGFAVFLDGAAVSQATHDTKRIAPVGSGRHELSVNLVTNPFKPNGQVMCKGFIDVPPEVELRIKCEGGLLTPIGSTPNAPPPPPPMPVMQAPDSRGAEADEMLSMAERQMGESPPACVRLRGDVRAIRDDLVERRSGRMGRHRIAAETRALSMAARDVCQPSVADLLRDASRILAPFGDEMAPPERRPQRVNPDQLQGMISAINSRYSGRERLETLRQVTRGSFFGTDQIATLLRLFSIPFERMTALRTLAPGAIDPAYSQPVIDCFFTPGERAEASSLLAR